MTYLADTLPTPPPIPCENGPIQGSKHSSVAETKISDDMRTPIQDEFTCLPISRQRKYQLRKKRDKRCTECGAPAIRGVRCLKHLVMARELQRKKRGLKRRY